MQLTTILNRVEKHKSFVYGTARWSANGVDIEVPVQPRQGNRPLCSVCRRPGPVYDHKQSERRFQFVPLWNITVWLVYRMRRVNCPTCGIKLERVPWSDGKSPLTKTYRWFLAHWARRLSWKETARIFRTSWQTVFRSVRYAVTWGIAHEEWSDIESIGIDEIAWQKGHRYLTLVYQIDEGRKRLLFATKERTKVALKSFFELLGEQRVRSLKFVVSDMWQPYLDVVAEQAGAAVHVLDRFHVMKKMNEAIDKVRREEVRRLQSDGYEPILKHSRWCLLKRPENMTEKETVKLSELLQYNLKSLKARLQREDFQRFWEYRSASWAGRFLDEWCRRVMRSRLEPMKKVARSLRDHRDLLLNWFRAKGQISAGVVEGFNNKVKLTMRKAFGFRTYAAIQVALYHNLGKLPEPEHTHTFW